MKPRLNSFWPEGQALRLEETWYHPYGEAWWWQHHPLGMFFSGREWETSQEQRNGAKYREILDEDLQRRMGDTPQVPGL